MANQEWRDRAKCRDMDANLFFPTEHGDLSTAKAVCLGKDGSPECPVRGPCLEYALALSESDGAGIWGGTSERERRRIRADRRAEKVDGRRVG